MSKNFPYGYNIEPYIDKALEILLFTYPWATRKTIDENYRYAIEKVGNRYHYISYWLLEDKEERRDHGTNPTEFIDDITRQNSSYIESLNPPIDTFKIDLPRGVDLCGWYLEQYHFRKHELGGYSAYVQAGNRSAGGSRTFFIPPSYFDGTYEEFLDKYIKLVPGGSFGLYKDDLESIKDLKEYLGFKK